MLKIYCEPESPSDGACSRYMINRYRQVTGHVEDMNEDLCFGCMTNQNSQMRGCV